MKAYDLRTDARFHPFELETERPLFSWRLRSNRNNLTAVGFVVELATERPESQSESLWSSGWVDGDNTSLRYTGPALASRTSYVWTLSLTDADGKTTSATARFETGFIGAAGWRAQWVGRPKDPWFTSLGEPGDKRVPTPLARSWQTMYSESPLQLRRRFTVTRKVVKARLYVTSLGVYRAYLNGLQAGQDQLTPGWTDYDSRIEYQAYDVTDSIRIGENVIAAEVADGWWRGFIGYNTRSQADQYGSRTALLAELVLLHDDGSTTLITSDDSWRELSGSVVMADLLMGEYHDSAMATDGWLLPGFDDCSWRPAGIIHEGEGADLDRVSGQTADPPQIIAELAPRSMTTHQGAIVVDFGQNLVGHVRLQLPNSPKGTVVELRHGEMLERGHVYTANLRSAEARDVLVASGEPGEIFEPVFTFHGFRYVEIDGLAELRPEDITAVVVSSDTSPAGTFHTSSELVNQLHQNIVWSQRSNFLAVPTDCPQRDERLGWTADAQIFGPTALLNSDLKAFFGRWLTDLQSSQLRTGAVPDVIPSPPTSTNFSAGAPGWGDAAVIVPWTLYTTYGDLDLLQTHYPSMRAWVDHITELNPDGLWTNGLGNNYGDWLSVDADTPKPVVAGAYQIRSLDLVARASEALNDHSAAARYRTEADHLRRLFEAKFVSSDGRVLGNTQTGYLFALAWKLTSSEVRGRLADHLVADIESRGNRLTTGFLGVSLLCPTLSDLGRSDLAYALLLQEDFPSWGYSIRHGATTIWERWDGYTAERGFQTVEMNSFNHYSLGSVCEWLYKRVAGIDQTVDSVGYRTLRIAPLFTPYLDSVAASYESVRGLIRSAWTRLALDEYRLELEIPPGSTAEVVLTEGVLRLGSGIHELRTTTNGRVDTRSHRLDVTV